MNDNAFWCTMVLGALGLVLSAVVAGMAIFAYRDCRHEEMALSAYRDRQYLEAGYTLQVLPGRARPEWVKTEPAK